MAKRKAGLHKKVSSIFDGVPVPQDSTSDNDLSKEVPGTGGKGPSAHTAKKVSAEASKSSWSRYSGKTIHDTSLAESGSVTRFKNRIFTPPTGVSSARHKLMLLTLPILTLVFVYVFWGIISPAVSLDYNTIQTDPIAPLEPLTPKPITEDVTPVNTFTIDWTRPDPIEPIEHDPMFVEIEFIPQPDDEKQGTGILVIQSILEGKTGKSAVIGLKNSRSENITERERAHEGDTVFGTLVVEINVDKNFVEFEKEGERWVVRMNE
ncbi:MAG: hypothetical protein JW860_06350 [Sedimentisphaerales bacterium]|nr:hypothetical protein [Sedimentisphaerales bacterium]